jgi:hypothetical protein
MQILKSKEGYQARFSPKELSVLLAYRFFNKLLSTKHLKNEEYNSPAVSKHIGKLSKESVDSKEYEYYTAILDLYRMFSKDCTFSFKLNTSFNPTKDNIKNLDDLDSFKDDPPDVIVNYKENDYEFELKRYRGKMTFEALYEFVNRKIILHYSGKLNFLIILQPNVDRSLSLDLFKDLHDNLIKEKNQPGYIGFSFNHENKEIITIRVLPKLEMDKRLYIHENDNFIDLFSND